MNRIEPIITNGKETIKCSNCGSEKKFILIIEPDLPQNNPPTSLSEQKTDFQMTERQRYVAHYFEAQKRFGE
jgi:hypothetical protein